MSIDLSYSETESWLPAMGKESFYFLGKYLPEGKSETESFIDLIEEQVNDVNYFTYELGLDDFLDYYLKGACFQELGFMFYDREGYYPEGKILSHLKGQKAKGVILNIPEVLLLPYFSYYSYDKHPYHDLWIEQYDKNDVRKIQKGDILLPNASWYYGLGSELDNPVLDENVISINEIAPVANYNRMLETLAKTKGYPNASYPNSTGWYVGNFASNAYERLFTNLKNVLSFYGNMLGVRAVLWHQGESETKTQLTQVANGVYTGQGTVPSGYSINNYSSRLLDIINETREILPGLGWAISKVSLTAETRISDNKRLYNIINSASNVLISSPATSGYALSSTPVSGSVLTQQTNLQSSNSSFVKWFTQNSDNYAYPTSGTNNRNTNDYVHFSVAGLNSMATDAYNNRTSFLSLTPVLNTPPPNLTLTRVGTQLYTVNVVPSLAGMSYVHKQWNQYDAFNSYSDYNQTLANNTSSFTANACGGFVKDNFGRIHIIPSLFFQVGGARISSSEMTASKVYPNPVNESSVIELFTENGIVTLEFFTENGLILETLTFEDLDSGKNVIKVPIEKLKSQKVVYLHITKSNNEKEAIRLLMD